MRYQVSIETQVLGDPEEAAYGLLAALASLGGELDGAAEVGVSEQTRMVMATLTLDAGDGRDAHDAGLEVFDGAWEEVFGDATSQVLAITCRPAGPAERAVHRAVRDDAEVEDDEDAGAFEEVMDRG